ncbi:MAG: SPP1 phage holin family protein [Syntrophomonadaceae bacterium]|nr:SPP1 phage holin family protein [Syntrophomonadaceae bacterium]
MEMVTKGTWVRSVVLLLALINQVLTALGKAPLPFSSEQAEEVFALGVTIITAVAAYNSKKGNSSCTDKLAVEGGFKESALRLNKYIVAHTSWGKEQVNECAALLEEVAKKAWTIQRAHRQ